MFTTGIFDEAIFKWKVQEEEFYVIIHFLTLFISIKSGI